MTDREKSNDETIVVTERQPENGQMKLTNYSNREPQGARDQKLQKRDCLLRLWLSVLWPLIGEARQSIKIGQQFNSAVLGLN